MGKASFRIQSFADEIGYPNDIFVYDDIGKIGTHDNPKRFTISELKDLYKKLGILIRKYEKWEVLYAKYNLTDDIQKNKTLKREMIEHKVQLDISYTHFS